MDYFEVGAIPLLTDSARLKDLFLRRLKRALLLRFYAGALLSDGDRHLLDRVIYSTYCDSLTVGADIEARRLLHEARAGMGLFKRPPLRSGGAHEWST